MEPLHLICENCNTRLKAPANLPVGKKVKCPKCGEPVGVKEPKRETAAAPPPLKKSCPFCGEAILSAAVKCRHCGEFLEEAHSAAPKSAALRRTSKTTDMNPAEYIVAIVGPVGLVVGLVWKLQKNPKAAEMLKISGLMSLLFLIGPLIYKQYATEKKQKSGPMASTVVDRNAPMPRPNRDEDEDPPERGRRATESDINAPKPADLAKYPAEIQRAMRSTVCILAGGGLGTGVIVQQDGNLGYVITNRHVVDQVFFASHGAVQTSASKLPTVKVKFVTDEVRPGKVVWLAGEIDLAIVEVACPKGVEIADIKLMPDSNVGDEVFAVGTPMGLGWTFTKGTISAFRDREYGPKKVSVVQTDARIGPGNSGGGLFSKKGDLLGINTFVMSGSRESAGETGLGFAIKKTLLAELKPEMLNFIPPKK